MNILKFLIVLSLPLILVAGGCAGGGTSGTGGGGFSVAGTLRTNSSQPIPGVKVVVTPQTSMVAAKLNEVKAVTENVTDQNGQFLLELDQRPDALNLTFSGDTFESNLAVDQIPATATGVTVAVRFDSESGEVHEESEQFEEDEKESSSGTENNTISEESGGAVSDGAVNQDNNEDLSDQEDSSGSIESDTSSADEANDE